MRRLAVLALTCFGCTRAESPAPFRLRIAAVGPLAPLAPDLEFGYSMVVTGLVFEPLVQSEDDGGWKSSVSRDWQKSGAAGFRFRPGLAASFSDGSAVRGRDFQTALEGRATVEECDGWMTLTWHGPGESPETQLLAALLWRPSDRGPIGTGPFVVATQDATHILLKRRNPPGRRVGEVELVSFSTPRDAFAAALRGEVGMLLMPDDGQLELLSGVDQLRLIHGPGVHSAVAFFNTARFDADDRRRLAVALPLDRVATAYGPSCRRAGSSGPSGSVPAGAPLELLVANTEVGLVRAALALRRALGPRGGSVTVVTPEEARKRASSGDFDLLIGTLRTWPPDFAASSWLTGSSRNLTGYSNARVDEALQASDYALAQLELEADPPALSLCRLDRTAAVDARLIDARLGDYDMLESLEAWQVAR